MVMYLLRDTVVNCSTYIFLSSFTSIHLIVKELRMKENIFLLKRNPLEGISYISLQGINGILESLTVCIVHVSRQYLLNSALIFCLFSLLLIIIEQTNWMYEFC